MTASSVLPTSAPADGRSADPACRAARAIVDNVRRVVRGRDGSVELVAVALIAGGHVLIEDVPGSGKTTLARAFARSQDGTFHRVQGTSDLFPADITGSGVWDPEARVFHFVPGPLFAHVVLVDELNRLPPRTQSAFLEAMEEAAVTADGQRHLLPDPFFVIATQNPNEQHGTFPLPEGQLDRFAVSLRLGPLGMLAERQVVREQLAGPTVDRLEPVIGAEELSSLRGAARTVHVSEQVLDQALGLVQATRFDGRVRLGASARAGLALVRCAQARALLSGREFVTPDDVTALAVPVLAHRLTLHGDAGRGPAEALVAELVRSQPVPVGT